MEESKRLDLLRPIPIGLDAPIGRKLLRFKLDLNVIATGSYEEKLAQAGIDLPRGIYFGLVAVVSLVAGYLGSLLGGALATFCAILIAYFMLSCLPGELAEKRRRKMVPQLPSFLDAMTAALSTGFSIDAALAQGAQAVPNGFLRDELENAVHLMRSGMTIDEAFRRTRQRLTGREIISVITAIDLFASMGGRMLDPFERLGSKMRDQERALERANRDLVQIKQAFMIIGGLSVLAPLAVFFMQPSYMITGVADPLGRMILQIAIMVELTCIFVFRRMVNLKV